MLTTDVCQWLERLGQSWERAWSVERGAAGVDGLWVSSDFGGPTLKRAGGGDNQRISISEKMGGI